MTNEARFWDRAAEKYAASPIRDQAAYEYTLERSQSYLRPDQSVLEIGCGTGSTAMVLSKHVANYLGTDVSEEMIGYAHAKAKADPVPGLRFSVSPVENALRATDPVDVICAFSILHLLRDLERHLRLIADRLPPGGVLISKTPCLGSMGAPMRAALKVALPVMQWFGKAPFVRSLRVAELEGLIERAGFEIVETVPSPKGAHHYVVARRK